ncbi:GMC family oxidoreductase, partial [Flexivirga sp. B27]
VNAQLAIRPPVEDFDDWVSQGCTGWSRHDVLPYFTKLEDDEEFGDEPYHGRGGPTPIYRTPEEDWGSVDRALARSALAAGHAWAPDVNAPGTSGVSPYPANSRDGRRVSVNDAYLEPARDLDTLTIRGGALVDRLLFSGSRVVGVQFVVDDSVHREFADTTVLSGGVIQSPAILMRSGIGPERDLRALGIEVLQDLPVGRGMQDHPMALISLPLKREAVGSSPHERHTNVCVRWTSDLGQPVNDMLFVSLNQNVLSLAMADPAAGAGAFGVWLNRNDSRGELTLTSTEPAVQPRVQQRMLSDERDRARLREGVRALIQLAQDDEATAVLDRSVEAANRELFAVLDDDSDLDQHLLATVGDAQHGTSTCRMGDPDGVDTVVDPECRVLGVDGVRVVDASIFPSVTRANPNLTVIMAAELMADRLG